MTEQQVPVIHTLITPQAYARAILTAGPAIDPDWAVEKDDVGVLYAQWMMETGGASCWNWNIGNAKHVAGDGFNFMCLNGVWEGVSPVLAGNLIAAQRAIPDPSPDHAKAVGPGKVSIIFPPPQPESRFRAFPDLATGMMAHLRLLHDRFAAAWPHVLAGEATVTAHVLGALRYFTANADVYGRGMQGFYDSFMKTSAFELAADELAAVRAAETPSAPIDNPASEPTIHIEPDMVAPAQDRDE